MRKNRWDEILSKFKEKEQPEAMLLVADSAQLTRIAVAWMNTPVCRAKRLSQCKGKDNESLWRWLWENTRFSREDLFERIPFSRKDTEQQFNALIANQALYPDGSINGYVAKYLREKIIKLFSKSIKIPTNIK